MNPMNLVNSMAIERVLTAQKTKEGDNYIELPDFKAGDNISVAVRVIEGEKERIQNFNGICISRRGAGISQTFRVRKISNGVGVERIFPLYSPMIQSIKILRKGKARRAKLYYLRGMSDRKIRQKLS